MDKTMQSGSSHKIGATLTLENLKDILAAMERIAPKRIAPIDQSDYYKNYLSEIKWRLESKENEILASRRHKVLEFNVDDYKEVYDENFLANIKKHSIVSYNNQGYTHADEPLEYLPDFDSIKYRLQFEVPENGDLISQIHDYDDGYATEKDFGKVLFSDPKDEVYVNEDCLTDWIAQTEDPIELAIYETASIILRFMNAH